MTTWAEVTETSVTYSGMSDIVNGYVATGYVVDDYIVGDQWSVAPSASTAWA